MSNISTVKKSWMKELSRKKAGPTLPNIEQMKPDPRSEIEQ